jgi:hypothetical protein
MAEFKLARLRFTWQGTWATAIVYARDDIVHYEGKTYVCLVPHTASDFYTDLAQLPISYWSLQVDGKQWTGPWTASTYYSLGNIIKFAGATYYCLTNHTSATNFAVDLAKWSIVSNGDNWKNAWTVSTNYGLGDIVRYGGNVYRCVTSHVSSATTALGLEADIANWEVNDLGVEFVGTWSSNTQYKLNQLVKYNGDVWQCTTAHAANAVFTPSRWTLFLPGQRYASTWAQSTLYQTNDVVNYGGYEYRSLGSNNSGNTPSMTSAFWEVVTTGYTIAGEWNTGTTYKTGSVVTRGGWVYQAIATSINIEPAGGVIIATYNPTGSSGTTVNVTGSYLTGIAIGQIIIGTGFTRGQSVVSVSNGGQTLGLNEPPDSTPSGTLTFTGLNTASWAILSPGARWRGFWDQGISFIIGDLVLWQNATYQCIQTHTSVPSNSPVADTTSNYWIVYLLHARNNASTKIGDITTYNTNIYSAVSLGPTGYVFRVSSDLPSWRFINKLPGVYYVSLTGADNPDWGVSIDRPWRSIKYACNVLLAGTTNQNAAYLINANKEFMVAETYQWMLKQKADNISPFRTTLVLNTSDISTAVLRAGVGDNSQQDVTLLGEVFNGRALADVNNTGVLNSADALAVLKYTSGILQAEDLTAYTYIRDIFFPRLLSDPVKYSQYFTAGSGSVFTQATVQQNARLFLDAVVYDITRGGNSQTVAATLGYFASSSSYANTSVAAEVPYFIAALNYLNSLVTTILSNTAITTNYQLINSVASPITQTINTNYFTETGQIVPANNAVLTIDATNYSTTGQYTINGINNVTLNLIRGNTYSFTVSVGTHILWIQTVGGAYSSNSVYSSGVLNNGIASGTITFTVPTTAPDTLYYQCQNHPMMFGIINIYDASSTVSSAPGALSTVNTLFSVLTTALTTVSTSAVPTANNGLTATIFVKSGTYSEVLPITIPANVAVVGDELRGVTVQPATSYNAITSACNTLVFTVTSTVGLTATMPIQFVGTAFGGITAGTTYYVVGSSLTATTFGISNTSGGAQRSLTTGVGIMGIYAGDALKNMFYMRDGSGIRNMTLTGLLGTLTAENVYMTRRPTGGAFVSLDPGTGTLDSRAWIYRRSPYAQNISMFGIGCSGLKVDGNLHASGNKSIVANDFTTVISDGIGAWITGTDAKSELVSVFSYYAYSGYMAEAGGRIRATNGNSSYGTYGVIAEGYDVTETPLSGNVFNRSTQVQASVQSSLGLNAQLLRLQYANAGRNYSTTTTNLLKYSNAFLSGSPAGNTSWASNNIGFQQNVVAPSNQSEGWTLSANSVTAGAGYIEQTIPITPSGATYTSLNASNLSGSGSGATFNVTVTGVGVYAVTVNATGSGYVVGNQMKISGLILGGLDSTNDVIITVATLTSSSIATITSTGTQPIASSKPYLISLYVKQGTSTSMDIYASFSGTTAVSSSLSYNFVTATATPSISTPLSATVAGVLSTSYGSIPQPTTGWYRVWFTIWDKIGLNNSLTVRIYPGGYGTRTSGINSVIYGSQIQTDVTTATLSYYLETLDITYTSYANYQVTGSGSGAVIQGDEIRSGSIFETRATSIGGSGYLTASNSSQGGTDNYIILAQSDTNTAASLTGMRVFITSGTGTGQYGYITTYNTASKIAQIAKESFDVINITSTTGTTLAITGGSDTNSVYINQIVQFIPTYYNVTVTNSSRASVTVTQTVGGTTNKLVATSTENLQLNMPVTFSGTTFGSITTGYTYYVATIAANGIDFQVSTTLYGTVWTLTNATGSMTMSMPTNTGYLVGSTVNMTPNMPISFTGTVFGGVATATTYYINRIIDATTFAISTGLVTVTVTNATASTNLMTTSSTASLVSLTPIVFSGTTFGGATVVAGDTYYINNIPAGGTTFTIAASTSILTRKVVSVVGASELITISGGTTSGFVVGFPVVFTGTAFGGIATETTYYILAVNDSTSFTIADISGNGINLTSGVGNLIMRTATANVILTTASGSMTATSTTPKLAVTSAFGSMTAAIATAVFGGLTQGTNYYIYAKTANTITLTTSLNGVTPVSVTTSNGSMSMVEVGWDHIIPGYPIPSLLDNSTTYFIELRIQYTDPAFSQTAITLPNQVSNPYSSIGFGNNLFLAVAGNSSIISRSTDGSTWSTSTLPSASNWTSIAYGNSYWVTVASGTDVMAYSSANGLGWRTASLPVSASWIKVVYGMNMFVAIATVGTSVAYSTGYGASWAAGTGLPSAIWTGLAYGSGRFVAVAGTTSNQAAYSTNGIAWTSSTLPSSTDWSDIAYGNSRYVAVSSTSAKTAYSFDGITWYQSNIAITASKISYGQGVFVAVSVSGTIAYTSDDGANWKQKTVSNTSYTGITFGYTSSVGNGVFVTVAGATTGSNIFAGVRTKGRAVITSGSITSVNMWEPGSNYISVPTVVLSDPNNTADAVLVPRIGNGALGNPTIISKGSGYSLNSTYISITGNGYSDAYQIGYTLIINNLSKIPTPGDNLTISGITDVFKVTSASVMYGTTAPNIEANVQVSPNITADIAPADGTAVSIRQKYSQVRLSGHDLLNIGYGNIIDSNYPNVPTNTSLQQQNQTVETNFGRVFYTTSDQDGNFKVGNLFGVEQATGIVTLSATQFGLSGLETLSLGGIAVGGSSVIITQFSTDGTLAANSDTIISTQKAIKTYITSRLSQGGSNTFTGNIIAGNLSIGNPNFISNQIPAGIAGSSINMPRLTVFKGSAGNSGWAGNGAALQMFVAGFEHRGNVAPGGTVEAGR